jgi:hypothetical protein
MTQAAPSKAGETRKKNNAFRRYIVAREMAIRDEKLDQLTDEQEGDIVGALEDVLDHYENRMDEVEEEILEECQEMIKQVVLKYGFEETEAMAHDYGFKRGHFGTLDWSDYQQETDDETPINEAKHMPMAELKAKYAGFLPEFEESYAETQALIAKNAEKLASLKAKVDPTAAIRAAGAKLDAWEAAASEVAESGITPEDLDSEDDAQPEPKLICGVCGRPWADGKCSGGFVNHKL